MKCFKIVLSVCLIMAITSCGNNQSNSSSSSSTDSSSSSSMSTDTSVHNGGTPVASPDTTMNK